MQIDPTAMFGPKPAPFDDNKLVCPRCGVFSLQSWSFADKNGVKCDWWKAAVGISRCIACDEYAVWTAKGRLLDPAIGIAPPPNADMPSDVKDIYDEANRVATISTRASAALLRLALQHLCIHLGGKGRDINTDIGDLVKQGMSPLIQQALDVVRVTGNNAVHPGQIDVDDDAVVAKLFTLLNVVVEQMISVPKHIQAAYNGLPQASRDAVAKRDAPKP